MRSIRTLLSLLGLIVLLGGCASATKRFDQGMDLELRGDYHAASLRYVEALQKDPTLSAARNRLVVVSGQAVDQHLQDAVHFASRGDDVAAATPYRHVDGLVARARTVGAQVDVPAGYEAQRRAAFDAAIENLFSESEDAAERGFWARGVDAARRARTDFEPSRDQRQQALDQEARLLVDWGESELAAGHLQAAYDRAASARALGAAPSYLEDAADVMDDALAQGQVELVALPLVAVIDDGPRRRGRDRRAREEFAATMRDLETRVNASLDRGVFRSPSPFVVMSDPIAVRELVRQAGLLDGVLRAGAVALVLRAVDADYGAWLELASFESTDFEIRTQESAVRTLDGDATTIVIEEGQRRLRAEAHVVVVDIHGNELSALTVIGSATAPFVRGRSDVDPSTLNLSRRQVDAFDELAHESAAQALRQALAQDLAARLGPAVLEPVLAQIP